MLRITSKALPFSLIGVAGSPSAGRDRVLSIAWAIALQAGLFALLATSFQVSRHLSVEEVTPLNLTLSPRPVPQTPVVIDGRANVEQPQSPPVAATQALPAWAMPGATLQNAGKNVKPKVRPDIPSGWLPGGRKQFEYEFGIGIPVDPNGLPGYRIQAILGASAGYWNSGILTRYVSAEEWRGKRVRLSALMKSERVWRLQLYLRVDGGPGARRLAFYNMDDRPIRGTTGWQRYAVVLDVPQKAESLALGFFLSGGQGVGWAQDILLEEVGPEVPGSVMPPGGIDERW